MGALSLYLNFINLFMMMLRPMGPALERDLIPAGIYLTFRRKTGHVTQVRPHK